MHVVITCSFGNFLIKACSLQRVMRHGDRVIPIPGINVNGRFKYLCYCRTGEYVAGVPAYSIHNTGVIIICVENCGSIIYIIHMWQFTGGVGKGRKGMESVKYLIKRSEASSFIHDILTASLTGSVISLR